MSLVPPPSAADVARDLAALRVRLAACDGGGRRCARSGSAACCSARACSSGIAAVVDEVRRGDGDVVLVADRRDDGRPRPARSRRSSPTRCTTPG